MAEEEKNEEKEAPEVVSGEEETASEPAEEAKPAPVEKTDTSEEKSEDAAKAEPVAAADDAESESPAVAKPEAKAKSETAPASRAPYNRRPSGPQTRGRGRPNYQNQGGGRPRRGYFRRKVCRLCVNKINSIDYKDVDMLRRFVTERGKIMPRRMTGTCAKHQRIVSAAVKRARMVALLPYVSK